MADVRDILEINRETAEKKKPIKRPALEQSSSQTKKSNIKGMSREVYALLSAEDKNSASLIPTDFPMSSKFGYPPYGYKTPKANLSLKKVRKWSWVPFTNPARKDGFQLYHWRHDADKNKEYAFAKLNVICEVPSYTDQEYQESLKSDDWTKNETDYLFSLCRRYDCRFLVVHDCWDENLYKERDVEGLKERFHQVCGILEERRNENPGKQIYVFDAEHERKRKAQLRKLLMRTRQEVAEEEELIAEMKKIELRKKEREKKTQDLQKLITATDPTSELRRQDSSNQSRNSSILPRSNRKKISAHVKGSRLSESGSNPINIVNSEPMGIKFPEPKTSGIGLRSARMKLPSSCGQKRVKAIEQVCKELNLDPHPVPTEEICRQWNELRSDMVLLYEHKMLLTNLEFELQSLVHQIEAPTSPIADDNTKSGQRQAITPRTPLSAVSLPESLTGTFGTNTSFNHNNSAATTTSIKDSSPAKKISEVIDVTNSTPRRRRAAMEQVNMMRKLKTKNQKKFE